MRYSFGFAALVALLACAAVAQAANDRQMLAFSCKNPDPKKVLVKGAVKLLTMNGKGFRTFWCNNSTLYTSANGKLHGQAEAKTVSTDGKFTGFHTYREEYYNGETDGMPYWDIINTATGYKRQVLATQKVQARQAVRGTLLDSTRRLVISDTLGNKPGRAYWVVRTNTTSKAAPTKCRGDRDEFVPFTATYTFYGCP